MMYLKQDGHLTVTSLLLMSGEKIQDAQRLSLAVIPHIVDCPSCFLSVCDSLNLVDATDGHDGKSIYDSALHWKRWQTAANTAHAGAVNIGRETGTGTVYGRDGAVYRRLPDGTEEEVGIGGPQDH